MSMIPIIDFENQSVGNDFNAWTFGDGDSSTAVSPSHFYADTGWFDVNLYVTTQYGCVDSVRHPVHIIPVPTIFVPNAFTPDDDGKNDLLTPVLYAFQDWQYEFYVFDRWGHQIFSSFTQGTGWDGKVNGVVASDGKTDVFVWKVVLRSPRSGDKKEFIGHVTLLK